MRRFVVLVLLGVSCNVSWPRFIIILQVLVDEFTGVEWELFLNMFDLLKVLFFGLHLDHEFTMTCVDLFRAESTAVSLEAALSLMPTVNIEVLKVISPLKSELIGRLVPFVNFNIIVKKVPRHGLIIKTLRPWVVDWCPEVHPQGLSFLFKHDSIHG